MKHGPPFSWEEPTRLGPHHTGPVFSVAGLALPDHRTPIISGADDRTVRRWDAGDPPEESVRWTIRASE